MHHDILAPSLFRTLTPHKTAIHNARNIIGSCIKEHHLQLLNVCGSWNLEPDDIIIIAIAIIVPPYLVANIPLLNRASVMGFPS